MAFDWHQYIEINTDNPQYQTVLARSFDLLAQTPEGRDEIKKMAENTGGRVEVRTDGHFTFGDQKVDIPAPAVTAIEPDGHGHFQGKISVDPSQWVSPELLAKGQPSLALLGVLTHEGFHASDPHVRPDVEQQDESKYIDEVARRAMAEKNLPPETRDRLAQALATDIKKQLGVDHVREHAETADSALQPLDSRISDYFRDKKGPGVPGTAGDFVRDMSTRTGLSPDSIRPQDPGVQFGTHYYDHMQLPQKKLRGPAVGGCACGGKGCPVCAPAHDGREAIPATLKDGESAGVASKPSAGSPAPGDSGFGGLTISPDQSQTARLPGPRDTIPHTEQQAVHWTDDVMTRHFGDTPRRDYGNLGWDTDQQRGSRNPQLSRTPVPGTSEYRPDPPVLVDGQSRTQPQLAAPQADYASTRAAAPYRTAMLPQQFSPPPTGPQTSTSSPQTEEKPLHQHMRRYTPSAS